MMRTSESGHYVSDAPLKWLGCSACTRKQCCWQRTKTSHVRYVCELRMFPPFTRVGWRSGVKIDRHAPKRESVMMRFALSVVVAAAVLGMSGPASAQYVRPGWNELGSAVCP